MSVKTPHQSVLSTGVATMLGLLAWLRCMKANPDIDLSWIETGMAQLVNRIEADPHPR